MGRRADRQVVSVVQDWFSWVIGSPGLPSGKHLLVKKAKCYGGYWFGNALLRGLWDIVLRRWILMIFGWGSLVRGSSLARYLLVRLSLNIVLLLVILLPRYKCLHQFTVHVRGIQNMLYQNAPVRRDAVLWSNWIVSFAEATQNRAHVKVVDKSSPFSPA